MLRSPTARRFGLVGFLSLLILSSPGASSAQVQPKQPADDAPAFRFSEVSAVDLAKLVVGVGGAPSVGCLQVVSALCAGEEAPFQVWRIEPPLLQPEVRTQVGASLLVLSGARLSPPTVGILPQVEPLLWFYLGDRLQFFALMDTSTVQKIPPLLLMSVHDERGIPDPETADLELDPYYAMLRFARNIGVDAFIREGRRDVGYTHLMNQPRRYRGEVIYVKGRLRLVKKYDAPLQLRTEGVPDIYEGWLFANGSGAAPVCILFTELPAGVPLEEKVNLEASFAGYFFKKYRYSVTDLRGNAQRRDAPLLIGRMPTLLKVPTPAAGGDEDRQLLWAFLILVVGTLFGVIGLTLWFRYHDRRVWLKIDRATRREFILPTADLEEKIRADQVTNAASEASNWNGSEPPDLSRRDRPTGSP